MDTSTKKSSALKNRNELALKKSSSLQRPPLQAKGFIELLARSNYSFLQAASSPEEMVEQAITLNYDGLAISDIQGLYGVVKGLQAAESPSHFSATYRSSKDFKFHFGSEIFLSEQISLVLLPMNKEGYYNLCRLLTLGKRQAAKGYSKLSLKDLPQFSENLLCFYLPPWKDETYHELFKIFQQRLYLPIWRDLTWESRQNCAKAFYLENNFQAQLFVTQRPFMHSLERKYLFDVVTCIYHGSTLAESKDRLIQNAERYLRPLDELSALWQDRIDLVEKTLDISTLLNFHLGELRYKYPIAQLPPTLTPTEHLRDLVLQGADKRFPEGVPESILKQIQYEIEIISELQYEDYFLTLKDICNFADQKKILYQGRGSAANSVVCFCLGLTAIDPIKMNLLFERFISRERREPPDIDIDFEHERREEVIQYIYEFYGQERAAMVCTVIRYRSKMALRETAKAFGVPLVTINKIIKHMGRDGLSRLYEPGAAINFGVDENSWNFILEIAQQLRGSPRHLGIHSGGFVITQDPIFEMVPVEKATMESRYVIQWNKDDIDYLKMMKIDILSLGMLSCLRKAFDLLKVHKHRDLSLATVPHDCPATYKMIQKAETVGIFQIESRAQMNTLPRMLPNSFYDLTIQIALIRPGPLQGGMVHPFLKLRQNPPKEIQYAHPKLKPILEKTLGVPIFQEQVMKIVVAVADFSPGEADELRRIMSSAWKRKASMAGVREKLSLGFQKNGINETYAEQIFKTIEGFANYGFPESHSASFAILAYTSSWLKCNYPDVFACALLNSQPMGFYEPRTIIQEARTKGVKFLDLDIQYSDFDYGLEDLDTQSFNSNQNPHTVRVGLRSIYHAPPRVLKQIVAERKLRGPFRDLKDFIQRTECSKVLLNTLAGAGAFKSFNSNARELIWSIESISLDKQSFLWGSEKSSLNFHTGEQDQLDTDEIDIGETDDISENQKNVFPRATTKNQDILPYESNWEKLSREYNSKGYSINSHPLSVLRSYLNEKNQRYLAQRFVPYSKSTDLTHIPTKKNVRIAGLLAITQRPPTAKGMCFLTLEDEFGFFNIVIKPDIYQIHRKLIYNNSLFEIQGILEKSQGVTNIIAARLLPLS